MSSKLVSRVTNVLFQKFVHSELVYPGSLLQGASLANATPDPVVVDRTGGTVVIDLLNGSYGVSSDVGEVRHSTVIQAMNDILAEKPESFPPASSTATPKSSRGSSSRSPWAST